MLKSTLIHPDILRAIAGAGHGSQILISDGNYPASTGSNPAATRAYLNLSPGVITATQALEAIASAIPIEAAHVMNPADSSTPPIFHEFARLLGIGLNTPPTPTTSPIRAVQTLERLERFAFYAAATEPSVCLVIATGEQRIYANILLTIGVVPPPKQGA